MMDTAAPCAAPYPFSYGCKAVKCVNNDCISALHDTNIASAVAAIPNAIA